jgi:hypothetical protein
VAISTKIIDTAIVPGNRRQTVSESTFDSSYAAEGEPGTAEELGLKRIIWAFALPIFPSESETVEFGFPVFVKKTDTTFVIQAFNYKTQKEIASTKNLEKVKVLIVAYGI